MASRSYHRDMRHFPTSPRTWLLALACLTVAASASADVTAFLGRSSGAEGTGARSVKGVAVGTGFLVVGFEFEFASTPESAEDAAPGLRTGMGNVLLQTPFAIHGVQPYATTGAGVYRETLSLPGAAPGAGQAARQETNVGFNSGGGVKIGIAGPLRLRLDYRVFTLRGTPLTSSPLHRFYAGANLRF